MRSTAAELASQLAARAEEVCRHYLPSGRRNGRYWQVGDVLNSPGRSLYVRLSGPTHGPGAAGKWTDAATGQHGDLLDLIGLNQQHHTLADAMDEARAFLVNAASAKAAIPLAPVPRNSRAAARRLFAASQPIAGSLAETYLHRRAIAGPFPASSLRFHPRCYNREGDTLQIWPALIAAITDLRGAITGVHRTWLKHDGSDKAPLEDPRRALGDLLENAVRIGRAEDVIAAGEGLETMLSLRTLMPALPIAAALSANHLAVLALPSTLTRLYIAVDNDIAGARAASALQGRAREAGIDVYPLVPIHDDWNSDLMKIGVERTAAHLAPQLASETRKHFLSLPSLS